LVAVVLPHPLWLEIAIFNALESELTSFHLQPFDALSLAHGKPSDANALSKR
jgi:hypothetical protein